MKKEIKIDIINKNDLLEKYDENKISKDVIEYLIKESMLIKKQEKIEIVVNKDKSIITEDCNNLIRKGLRDEYKRSIEVQHDNNVKQIYFLILGIILLFFSTQLKQNGIWKEILLISGWVPIWEMVKIELFPDVQGRIRRKHIKKLLNSNIIEKIN